MKLHYILIGLLMLAAVSAQNFEVGYSTINNQIFLDETAVVELTIDNNLEQEVAYQVYSVNPSWLVYADQSQIRIPANDQSVVRVSLDPTSQVSDSDNYEVPIAIRSLYDQEVVQINPVVSIKSERFREYAPSIFVNVVVGDDGALDPRDNISVQLRVVNRNPRVYDDFVVDLRSPLFSDRYETSLDSLGDFIKVLTFPIDPQEAPINTSVTVSIEGDGETIGSPRAFSYNVVPIYPPFAQDKDIDSGF